MKTYKITTRELFENAVASAQDVAWQDHTWDGVMNLLDMLVTAKIDSIRQSFMAGYTAMMMGKLFEGIENRPDEEIEIRVFGEDDVTKEYTKLIGVIIDSEINY